MCFFYTPKAGEIPAIDILLTSICENNIVYSMRKKCLTFCILNIYLFQIWVYAAVHIHSHASHDFVYGEKNSGAAQLVSNCHKRNCQEPTHHHHSTPGADSHYCPTCRILSAPAIQVENSVKTDPAISLKRIPEEIQIVLQNVFDEQTIPRAPPVNII